MKLKKTLYRLKQSPCEWDAVLFQELIFSGLRQSTFKPNVFINKNNSLFIAAIVDDLGTCFSNPAEARRIAKHVARTLQMTDNGKITWSVCIWVTCSNSQITLSQSAFVQQILERFNLIYCRMFTTSFENDGLLATQPVTTTAQEIAYYQPIISSLMYAALGTRPEITFATTILSQFSSNPGPDRFVALQQVLDIFEEQFN